MTERDKIRPQYRRLVPVLLLASGVLFLAACSNTPKKDDGTAEEIRQLRNNNEELQEKFNKSQIANRVLLAYGILMTAGLIYLLAATKRRAVWRCRLISGYEICLNVLNHPQGGVKKLLELSGGECYWLELKAAVSLSAEDEKAGVKPEELYWSIANAAISLANAAGGAVIIGIDDKTYDRVPLDGRDPKHLIRDYGLERYLRCAIMDKIWPTGKKKNWGTKNDFHVKGPLPPLVSIRAAEYQDGKVAVMLVRPAPAKCLRNWKGETEEIRVRAPGKIGETTEIIGSKEMDDYERHHRNVFLPAPAEYNEFMEPQEKFHRRKLIIFFAVIIAMFFDFALLMYWQIPWIFSVLGVMLPLAAFAFAILPLLLAPLPVAPIPGRKTLDEFVIKHPRPTWEWYCLNHHVWWDTSDVIETCYGTWELQRNKISGNGHFRIVDPRNIMRCWGRQEQVLPIFENLREKLGREAPAETKK